MCEVSECHVSEEGDEGSGECAVKTVEEKIRRQMYA